MASAFPCRGINIHAPFISQAGGGAHTFIYAVATESLGVYNPILLTGESSDLITTYGSTTTSSQFSRNENLNVVKPQGFDNVYVMQNATTGYAGEPNQHIDTVQNFNILANMSTWGVVTAGATATFTSSSFIHPLGPLVEVYELDAGAATGTSEAYGLTIDSADYARLRGKPCVCQIDVANQNAGSVTTVTLGGFSDTHTGDNYRTFYINFIMPTSGTFDISVKRSGTAGRTLVAIPRIAEFGADFNQMVA